MNGIDARIAVQDAYARMLGRKFTGRYVPPCQETLKRRSAAVQARYTDAFDRPIDDVRRVAACVKHGR